MTNLSYSHPAFIGKFDSAKPVRVYGAGIAGLSCAYFAMKAGFEIELHEKTNQVGGLIKCEKTTAGFVDSAAHTILVNDELIELFKEINLNPEYFPKQTKRLLCRKGKTFQVFPLSLTDLPDLISKGFKKVPASALNQEASVADFFTPWVGEKVTRQIVSTALSGIYAAQSEELHFRSIFEAPIEGERYLTWAKRVIKKIRANKTQSASFVRGMATLPEAFAKRLLGKIHYNSSPQIDDHYNNIICTSAYDVGSVYNENNEHIETLSQIPYVSLKKSTVFLRKKITQLDKAFGALLSEDSDFKSMGIINTSYLFPQRTFNPNQHQYSFLHKTDTDVAQDLKNLGIERSLLTKTFDWPKGIPLYSKERAKAIDELKEQNLGSVILFGNYTGEISLRKMILASKSFFKL